jgi:hypothetical protein
LRKARREFGPRYVYVQVLKRVCVLALRAIEVIPLAPIVLALPALLLELNFWKMALDIDGLLYVVVGYLESKEVCLLDCVA